MSGFYEEAVGLTPEPQQTDVYEEAVNFSLGETALGIADAAVTSIVSTPAPGTWWIKRAC